MTRGVAVLTAHRPATYSPRLMPLRYRCLLIDHDDTAVDSTATIHHPAHVQTVATLRPGRTPPTLEQWFLINFHPGLMEYLVGDLGLSDAEVARAMEIWRTWTTTRTPHFYPGFLDVLRRYKEAGGRIVVISHSERDIIQEHYRRAGAEELPDAVFGWENEAERRKPNPWPVTQALERYRCPPRQAIVVDDLKPGVLMARAAGVPFAAAGWGHKIGPIESYMRSISMAYLPEVEDLGTLLMDVD